MNNTLNSYTSEPCDTVYFKIITFLMNYVAYFEILYNLFING